MAAQKLTYQSEGTPEIFWTVFKNGQAQKFFFTPKNRVNYYPYGKTLRQFVSTDEKFLTTQHERDAETGLDYRGARFYDADVARFLSLDPLAAEHPSLSDYNYVNANPVAYIDPDGKDGIFIVFPEYRANGWPGTGHAGVLIWDNETGVTKYYEYGRYDAENNGEVRQVTVPDLVIGQNGLPTMESLYKTMEVISDESGHSQRIQGVYVQSDMFDEMHEFAEEREALGNTGEKYNILTNNCGTFGIEVLEVDPEVDFP